LIRGQVLSLRETDYVTAARATGASDGRILRVHILPGVLPYVMVASTLGMASAILTEAALSFLGLGVQIPVSTWGNMLYSAQSLTVLQGMPWLWLPPGAAIALSVLAANFVGDGLRDALDPRMRID
jgi:peptide/nickel transport system permease protein